MFLNGVAERTGRSKRWRIGPSSDSPVGRNTLERKKVFTKITVHCATIPLNLLSYKIRALYLTQYEMSTVFVPVCRLRLALAATRFQRKFAPALAQLKSNSKRDSLATNERSYPKKSISSSRSFTICIRSSQKESISTYDHILVRLKFN